MVKYFKDRRRRSKGGNESQSKFFEGTWHISQNQPDVHLFPLSEDRLVIDKLSALRTKLGTTGETWLDANKNMCEIDNKSRTKIWFISSQTFHRTPCVRVQGITARVQFRLVNLDSFDSVTQELYQNKFLQQSPHTIHNRNIPQNEADRADVATNGNWNEWRADEQRTTDQAELT
jgi:hypothetical protein